MAYVVRTVYIFGYLLPEGIFEKKWSLDPMCAASARTAPSSEDIHKCYHTAKGRIVHSVGAFAHS